MTKPIDSDGGRRHECLFYPKSEQFNGFAKSLFFGGEGIIAENIRHEQQKVVKYNHLVANMVILHNVVGMAKVLTELRDEDVEITPEILGGLGPVHIQASQMRAQAR